VEAVSNERRSKVEKERNNAQQHASVMNEKTETIRVPAEGFSSASMKVEMATLAREGAISEANDSVRGSECGQRQGPVI
jgi:hypothetical protein